ncbi:MAG: hypothetical protein ACKO3W_12860 [bacterium]
MDPFARLSLEPTFDVDPRRLRAAWLRVAATTHPDAIGTVDSASLANDAYRALSDPIERAHALLRLHGQDHVLVDEVLRRALPDGFLLEMMEYRERADALDASDVVGRSELLAEAQSLRGASLAKISELFARFGDQAPMPDACREAAAAIVRELNVVRSFDRMIEQVERERGEPAT